MRWISSWGGLGRVARSGVFAAAVPAVAAGCDAITGSRTAPEEATVHIESLDVGQATIVTSDLFSIQGGDVSLLEADTQAVVLPFEGRFRLGEAQRFFVSTRPGEGNTPSLRMRVWIDGKSWYDETRAFAGDSVPAMQFIYRFTQPVLN